MNSYLDPLAIELTVRAKGDEEYQAALGFSVTVFPFRIDGAPIASDVDAAVALPLTAERMIS